MTGVDVITCLLILAMVVSMSFAIMLALPGLIECIADAIIETRWATDKLKEALRGDEDGKND